MSTHKKGYEISVRKLSKSFGEFHVLNNVNLDIQPGEFVAILGKSGCGKSTLLRLIEGLDRPTTGKILLNGEEHKGVDSNVRFVFQDPRLLPWKRIIDNVRIGAEKHNSELAERALENVGLLDRKNEWPSILSGGQKQRVSLARALADQPKVLLLDEPLGALDAFTRLDMQNLIENLWKEYGFTAIIVTHDVNEAVRLADRVIVIENNIIKADIKIELSRPRVTGSDSSYYEKLILSHIMEEDTQKQDYII